MQRLQGIEQDVRERGDLAGVRQGNGVAARHGRHQAALLGVELGEFAAHAAGGEVGDDAVAHSGGGVVELGQAEFAQRQHEHGDAGHDNLGALGADTGDLPPRREIAGGDVAVELGHLRRRRLEAIGRLALGARHAVDGADHGGGGGGGGDGAIVGRLAEAAHGVDDALLDVLLHPMQLERAGRIVS